MSSSEAIDSSKLSNIVLISTLDHIDKERAFKQRSNRPFKVIQNLPLSPVTQGLPDYSRLEHPLSIKDSAVLYNSLLVSRYNWTHNIFKAYWTRREQYLQGNDTKKKDRTAKLCSAKLTCGPHSFDIKLFILKDEETEKKFLEEQEKKREERQKKKLEREEAQKKRIEELKIKMEQQGSMKNESKPKRVSERTTEQIMRDPEQASMINNLNLLARSDEYLSALMKHVASGNASPEQIMEFQKYIQKAKDMSKLQRIQQNKAAMNMQMANQNNVEQKSSSVVATPSSSNDTQKPLGIPTQVPAPTAAPAAAPVSITATTPATTQAPTATSATSAKPAAAPISQTSSTAASSSLRSDILKDNNKPAIKATPPAQTQKLESFADNEKTILSTANLSKIKKPMTKKELREDAKRKEQEMLKRAEEFRIQQQKAQLERTRLKEEKEKEKLRLKQEKIEQKQREREEREKQKQLMREEREKQKELKRQQREAEREKEKIDKAEKREREKMAKSRGETVDAEDDDIWNDKLTLFQERYAENATFIFEFNENASARFFLPRDAIFEKIENDNEELEDDKSTQNDPQVKKENHSNPRKSPYVTLLCSFILVHNQTEIDGWERRHLKEISKEEPETEDKGDTRKKRRKKANNWSSNKRVTRQTRHSKELETLKREEEDFYVEDEDLEDEGRPIEIYSCVTVKLRIPFRFSHMLQSSGNNTEISKKNMEDIMKRGTKMPQSYVWNQLDGIKDELLAENLRFNLQKQDYTNGSNLKGRAIMKKLLELGYKKK